MCKAWIESYRHDNHGLTHRDGEVPFHRRHAEWLVLLSTLWMAKEFPGYVPLADVEADFGDRVGIRRRFVQFLLAEAHLINQDQYTRLINLAGCSST